MTLSAAGRSSAQRARAAARRHLIVRRVVPAAVLSVTLWLLLAGLATYPAFWFDEGYKATAARTLAEYGRFASRSASGVVAYDPGISGGVADIGSMAISFSLFGVSVWAARLPSMCFGLLAIAALFGLVRAIHGPRVAAVTCLTVLAAPPLDGVSVVLLGRQALAEVPALALLLSGLYVEHRARGGAAGALLAGLLWGLGMLSRQQWALTMGPALVVWAGSRVDWRAPDWPSQARRAARPVLLMAATVAAWKAFEYFDVPADLRAENVAMALEASRTNLVTGLWGRGLDGTAWALVGLMVTAGGLAVGWLRARRAALTADQRRLHACLATGTIVHAAWFALFSVGWPRYALPGVVLSIVALAIMAADVAARRVPRVAHRRIAPWLAVCVGLGAVAIAQAPGPRTGRPDRAAQMAAAVTALVPREALIESWEWEIAALIGPERVHTPHQRFLFEAIRMRSHEGRPIVLRYDMLQRNPAFLIRGPFEALARVYDDERLAACFRAVLTIEPYTLFARSGCWQEAQTPSGR